MRKRWIMQILSLIVSGSMLFTGIYSCPAGLSVAKAAVVLPKPVYEYGFESLDPDKGKIIGGGLLTDSGDSKRGKVFENKAGDKGSRRANYFLLPGNIFSTNADNMKKNKGMTVSFFVNGNGNASVNAPLFSASASPPNNSANTAPMFMIQGEQSIQLNANGTSDFTSRDNQDGFNCLSLDHLKDGQWHNITVTVSDEKAVYYVDGVAENIWKHNASGFLDGKGIGALCYICLGGNQAWSLADPDAFYQFDDIRIFDEELDSRQIYKLMTDKEPVTADKTKLRSVIRRARLLQQELYKEESLAIFNKGLESAKKILYDGEASQADADAAARRLLYLMKREFTDKKEVDLQEGCLLRTDFTAAGSCVDKIKNCIIADGYTIKLLGTSTIEKGYIQSSKNGISKKAGISVDRRVLDGIDMERGITFNIKWRFSHVNSETGANFQDLIAFVDRSGKVLMKNTLGFIFAVEGYPWLYPSADVKNGFDWDSCKYYETDADIDFTMTIDNSGCRMYVDGVLACEKTDISRMDMENILAGTENIVLGRDTSNHGDLMGGFYGLQVYNRTLNAAEVEALTRRPVSSYLYEIVIDTEPNAEVSISYAGIGQTVFITLSDDNGKAVLDHLLPGEYVYNVKKGNGIFLTGKLTVYYTKTPVRIKADHSQIKNETGKKQQITDKKIVSEITLYTGKAQNERMVQAEVSGVTKTVVWRSSNPKVAAVSKGKITAVGKGTALITAEANGISRSVKVRVKNPVIQIKKGKKRVSSCRMKRGKTVKLKVSVTPEGSGIRLKKLSKRDKDKVKVKVKRDWLTITGKKKGKVTLIVRSGGNKKKIRTVIK